MKKRARTVIKHAAKSMLDRLGLLNALRSVTTRRRSIRSYAALQRRVKTRLFPGGEVRVLSGPFEGMKYIDDYVWGSITPKWLGSYEGELWGTVEKIIESKYDIVVDVGSAEGFYAVGLLTRMPFAVMHAFDVDFISRRQVARLGAINEVSARLKVGKYCSSSDIAAICGEGRSLVVCDIEGWEYSLLDPQACPALLRVDILVEVHEGEAIAGNAGVLSARFSASHVIERIDATGRDGWISGYISRADAITDDREFLLEATAEHRSDGNTWLWMRATNPHAPGV